jgi:MFS transporter, MFS domain-containing protein family, molybdate-anion transporter
MDSASFRILSGISTSLLFSVFESWMVSEHYSRGKYLFTLMYLKSNYLAISFYIGFHQSLLSDTFSLATYGNGLVAIFSGLLANWLVERFGVTSPFLAAIGFFALAALVITFTWKENYGNKVTNFYTAS